MYRPRPRQQPIISHRRPFSSSVQSPSSTTTKDETEAWRQETVIRPAVIQKGPEGDLGKEGNFIASNWRETFVECDEAGPLPLPSAIRAYREAIVDWLSGWPGISVLVAVSRVYGELIGFVVTYETKRHGKLLMYVFVKRDCQSKVEPGSRVARGVASMLLEAAGFEPGQPYTMCFRTPDWQAVMRNSRRWKMGVYRPKPAKFRGSNHVERKG